jgi:hypothetical protein
VADAEGWSPGLDDAERFLAADPDSFLATIGTPLFERALGRAGRRVVGLDGVLAQQASYERRGFVLAHRNVRWRTMGGGERPEPG